MTDKKIKIPIAHWLDILTYTVRGNRRWFVACLLFGLLSNGFVSAANPLALKYLFDEGIIRQNFQRFALISVGFVAIFTLWRVGVFVYRLYTQRLKNAVFAQLSESMLRKYYKIPYGEVIQRDRGYFLSRIFDEVSATAALVIDTTLMMSNMLVTLVVALTVALSISVRATLMVLIAVPVLYVLSQKYGNKIKRESMAEQEEEAKVRGVLERAVGSYKTARIFQLEAQAQRKVSDQVREYINAFFARFKTSSRYEMLSGIFMSYVENIAIVAAGYEILSGRMTFGGYVGFMSAFWAVMGAVRGVFGLVPELSRASGMAERLREFEALEVDLPKVRYGHRIELDHIDFGYTNHQVFSDLTLAPEPGERILIIGANGSGKSTLAHLICGLLQPTSGVTTTYPLDRISAVVLPHDFIPGTVRDNLSFVGSEQQVRLEQLSSDLGIGEILDKKPSELSAGQRKRLEVLMALLKTADVYIIDEPLAGIDVASKGPVMHAILESTQGKTLMVIMHGDDEFHDRFDRLLDLDPPAGEATPASWRPFLAAMPPAVGEPR